MKQKKREKTGHGSICTLFFLASFICFSPSLPGCERVIPPVIPRLLEEKRKRERTKKTRQREREETGGVEEGHEIYLVEKKELVTEGTHEQLNQQATHIEERKREKKGITRSTGRLFSLSCVQLVTDGSLYFYFLSLSVSACVVLLMARKREFHSMVLFAPDMMLFYWYTSGWLFLVCERKLSATVCLVYSMSCLYAKSVNKIWYQGKKKYVE